MNYLVVAAILGADVGAVLGISLGNILLALLAIPASLLLMMGVGTLAFLVSDKAMGKPEQDSRTVGIVAGIVLGGSLTVILAYQILDAPVQAMGMGAAAAAVLGGIVLTTQEVRAARRRAFSRQCLKSAEIALTLGREGSFADAEDKMRETLLAAELAVGSLHPTVAEVVNSMAELYLEAGRFVPAETLFKRTLSVYEQLYFGSNPGVAATLHHMGRLYARRGDPTMAIPVCKRSLGIYERAQGRKSVNASRVHVTLARLFLQTAKLKDAETHARLAAVGLTASLGAGHPDAHAAVGLHVSTLVRLGRYSEAERHLRQVLADRQRAGGRNDARALDLLLDLAQIHTAQLKPAEALQTYRQSLQIYREEVGPEYERGKELMQATLPSLVKVPDLPVPAPEFLNAVLVERDTAAAKKLLDDNPALLNMVDGSGWTPLQWATFYDLDTLADTLLFRKAEIGRGQGDGMPALHIAARWGRLRILMTLIQKGVDINMVGQAAMTAAHHAAILGDSRTMDILMSKNIGLEVWNELEYTPLHYAAAYGHAKLVIEFISKGQAVDSRGPRTGRTPLHAAVEGGCLSTTQALVFNGADLFLKDRDGRNAMDIARANGNPQIQEFLSAHGRAGAESAETRGSAAGG
ncbi:MAG: tetratricopeptide repeat protein [Armatimonadetes bacterium]|nr:tetratricopeptide repeat protein [Armatimonadota bacterium]